MLANMFSLDKIIIYFLIYSFIGYCCEVTYCSIPAKRFINRGFLYGPYLPIYGFGAVIVLLLLEPFYKQFYLVLIFGFFITSLLEYFTSWLLEKVFHIKLWDYSKHKVNIHGRVCLLNSCLFACMCLVLVYVIQPFISKLVDMIPQWLQNPLAVVIAVGMSVDATISIFHMVAFKQKLKAFTEKKKDFQERIALLQKEGAHKLAATSKAKFDNELAKLRTEIHKSSRRLMDAFPTMRSANEEKNAQLDRVREGIRLMREKAAIERAEKRAEKKEDGADKN